MSQQILNNSSSEEFSPVEIKRLVEFRKLCANLELPPEQKTDAQLVRWLRARDLNVKKAYKMLAAHLQWRSDNKVDGILERETIPPELQSVSIFAYVGCDKDGYPIFIAPWNQQDMCALLEQFGEELITRVTIMNMEMVAKILRQVSKERGREITQIVQIIDMEGGNISQMMNSACRNLSLEMQTMLDQQYPEILKLVLVINAPRVFSMVFRMFKPFMSKRTLEKIDVYGVNREEWKQVIREKFPVELIPKHWGGTKEGSDEFCSQDDIWINGPLPPDFFDGVTSCEEGDLVPVTIKARDTFKVTLPVANPQSSILCRFHCEHYDIGFQILDPNSTEILTWKRVTSNKELGEEHHNNTVAIKEAGDYTVVFDNSYSVTRSKTVLYSLSVIDGATT